MPPFSKLNKVKVRVTNPSLISSFGREVYMTFEQASHYKDLGFVQFIHVEEKEKIKNLYLTENKKWSSGTKIAWVEDSPTSVIGGAELSNKQVKKIGRKLGFDIITITQQNFSYDILESCDIIILNYIFLFSNIFFDFIKEFIWEKKKPYIKYDHDHREMMSRGRLYFSIPLFHNSLLNVFISPFHFMNFFNYMGEGIYPYYILPPPIDTKIFRKKDYIQREKNKVVHTSGKLHQAGKGLFNLVNYVFKHPNYKYEFYTRIDKYVLDMVDPLKDKITLKERVSLEKLVDIYNTAEYAIHLPVMPEAAGRIMMEAYLCGCKLIMNRYVGLKSFKFPWENYEAVKEIVELGPYKFWKEVEKVI